MDMKLSDRDRQPQLTPHLERAEDAVYQQDRLVARVLDAEVDMESRQVRFGEMYNSDELLLPDECEFQKYRILIRKVEYATKVDKQSLQKGRILKAVTAEILSYRQQA